LQKIANWGLISLAIVLSLAILPQANFGQIPTLDKLNLDNNQSPQCLDFNQDKICEFIVLTNGTMVENPDMGKQVTEAQSQAISQPTPISESKPVEGKCLGKINPRTHVCPYVLLDNGTVIDNPNNETLVSVIVDPRAYSVNSDWYKELVTEREDEAEVEDTTGGGSNNDDNDNNDEETANCGGEPCTPTEKEDSWTDECFENNDGSLGDPVPCNDVYKNPNQPYCDEVDFKVDCWDRKDYSDLYGYPCRDGSYEEDWRDCD
jgi:hypothetical protein